MTVEEFKKLLTNVKNDYNMIDKKVDELTEGLSSFLDDAGGVGQSWLYDTVKHELKNLIYAANSKLLGRGDNQKVVDDKIDDFIDYYMVESYFDGYISWEDEYGKHEFHLANDEDVYKYIQEGIVA